MENAHFRRCDPLRVKVILSISPSVTNLPTYDGDID